jgi:hypothetical protein
MTVGLNFTSLRELYINQFCKDAEIFMDLALNSTRSNFDLHLVIDRSTTVLCTHQLLQRITLFELNTGSLILFYTFNALIKLIKGNYLMNPPSLMDSQTEYPFQGSRDSCYILIFKIWPFLISKAYSTWI